MQKNLWERALIIGFCLNSLPIYATHVKDNLFEQVFSTINSYWGSVLFFSDHPLKLPLILVVMLIGGFFFYLSLWFC